MAKSEAPLSSLEDYIPTASAPLVFDYLRQFRVHLTITRTRKSILGDYRHAIGSKNHRISVNGDLNKFSFLITLIHELAHLVTFNQYQHSVLAHGKEWKRIYQQLLIQFLGKGIFPADIEKALEQSLHNLPASSCADEGLMRVLMKYDEKKNDLIMVENIPHNSLFMTMDGKLFRKGKQLRKRIQCLEMLTKKLYLFSPVYEVKPVPDKNQNAS